MRDYAKKDKWYAKEVGHAPKRKRPVVTAPSKPMPSSLWMVVALVIGLLIVVAVWQFWPHHAAVPQPVKHTVAPAPITTKVEQPEEKVTAAEAPAATTSAQPKQRAKVKAKPPAKPQFDFYTILPNSEVKTGVDPEDATATSGRQFMLQVASYKENKAAQAMRARLLLVGLSPHISSVGHGSNRWYRVDLGPFDSMRKADVVRHTLQDNGINGAMIRQIAQ